MGPKDCVKGAAPWNGMVRASPDAAPAWMRAPIPRAALASADRPPAPLADDIVAPPIDIVDIAPPSPSQQQQQHPAAPVWPAGKAPRLVEGALVPAAAGMDTPVDPMFMNGAMELLVAVAVAVFADPVELMPMDGVMEPATPVPIVALPPAIALVDADGTGGVSGVSGEDGALDGLAPLLLLLFAPIDCITWSNEADAGALKGISTPEPPDDAAEDCARTTAAVF